jgi:hypothetical protein
MFNTISILIFFFSFVLSAHSQPVETTFPVTDLTNGNSVVTCTNGQACLNYNTQTASFSINLANQSSYRVDIEVLAGSRVYINYGSPASSSQYSSVSNGQSSSNDFTSLNRTFIQLRCCDVNDPCFILNEFVAYVQIELASAGPATVALTQTVDGPCASNKWTPRSCAGAASTVRDTSGYGYGCCVYTTSTPTFRSAGECMCVEPDRTPVGCIFDYSYFLCGNRRLDFGEDCDSGIGCSTSCTCLPGFTPNVPAALACNAQPIDIPLPPVSIPSIFSPLVDDQWLNVLYSPSVYSIVLPLYFGIIVILCIALGIYKSRATLK